MTTPDPDTTQPGMEKPDKRQAEYFRTLGQSPELTRLLDEAAANSTQPEEFEP